MIFPVFKFQFYIEGAQKCPLLMFMNVSGHQNCMIQKCPLSKKIHVYEFIWTPHVVVYDFCEITTILLETQVTGTANKQIL